MADLSNCLLHLRICEVTLIHDYLQIHFEDGTVLNLFNVVSVSQGVIADLLGTEVIGVHTDPHDIRLRMDNGLLLSIGMTDADYQGPEAMEYIPHDGERVVWP